MCIIKISAMNLMKRRSLALSLLPVLFPKGHAVAAVVLDTDVYQSSACADGPEMDECHVVDLEINGKHLWVLLIEATLCSTVSDFTKAVDAACLTIQDNNEYISKNGRYCLIKMMRQKGIDPIIGL